MEFLRFGSSIPGGYWGCCAADIIQDFTCNPDDEASIELVEGDGGTPLGKFAGKTYRDIFLQRLRYGTFSVRDMPNHAFFVILSQNQIDSSNGKKWLAILKEQGFEFLRKVNNSVWNVNNYIFFLCRNVGKNAVDDMFTPPSVWTDLPDTVTEPWKMLATPLITSADTEKFPPGGQQLTQKISGEQKPLFDALPSGVFYTREELEKEGIPITLAGKRSSQCGEPAVGYPQQEAEDRQMFEEFHETRAGKKEEVSLRASLDEISIVAPFPSTGDVG